MIAATYELAIEIGQMPIVVRTQSAEFMRLLEDRYGPFVVGAGRAPAVVGDREAESGRPSGSPLHPVFELEIDLGPPGLIDPDAEVRVSLEARRWIMERGDFRAELDPQSRCGWVRQTANPYSIDGVLRILHSLILAREGGFLVHAASAVRNGRAYLFAGVSGAGKTTLSRLAPPDVKLLTDEISYVRKGRSQESRVRGQEPEVRGQKAESRRQKAEGTGEQPAAVLNPKSKIQNPKSIQPADVLNPKSKIQNPKSYVAFGTPFAGELARVGENLRAPLEALYLLAQGPENRIEPVSDAEAARAVLRHILFFAQDEELVGMLFQSVLEFVSRVPVRRLVFAPDPRVWELIA